MNDKDCKNGVKIDTAVNKSEISHIKDDIVDIKINHLPHIYKRLGRLETKIAYWSGSMAILIIIANIIINKF